MILYGSSIADGNATTHHDLPLVLAGGSSCKIKGGQHIRYAPETPMNNLLLTMLDRQEYRPRLWVMEQGNWTSFPGV